MDSEHSTAVTLKNVASKEEEGREQSVSLITNQSLKGRAVISNDGGKVIIDGADVALRIPRNAFTENDKEHNIQIQILPHQKHSDPAESFEDHSTVMVKILPDNLTLQCDATLCLPHCLELSSHTHNYKVQVFQSHNGEEEKPVWEDVSSSASFELNERTCEIRIRRLCATKYTVSGNVKYKRIILYALVENCYDDAGRVAIDVGYFPDLPGANKIFQFRCRDKMLSDAQSFLFHKKNKQDLEICLSTIRPENWKLTQPCQGNIRKISYFNIEHSNEQHVPFFLEQNGSTKELPRCIFKICQNQDRQPSYLSVIVKGPQSQQTPLVARKPTKTEIMNLSREIGSKWRDIGRELQLPESYIVDLSTQNNPLSERVYQMLCEWMKRESKKATGEALQQALRNAGRSDLADDLCSGLFSSRN